MRELTRAHASGAWLKSRRAYNVRELRYVAWVNSRRGIFGNHAGRECFVLGKSKIHNFVQLRGFNLVGLARAFLSELWSLGLYWHLYIQPPIKKKKKKTPKSIPQWNNHSPMTWEMQYWLMRIHSARLAKGGKQMTTTDKLSYNISIQSLLVIIILPCSPCIQAAANKWKHQRYTLLQGDKKI